VNANGKTVVKQMAENNPDKSGRSAEVFAKEIKELAESGDFRQAEELREYLLATHPMALSAIISTAEIIEDQKTLRIDQDHLAIWDTLYSGLSKEERNCLFYATKNASIANGKVIIRQGKPVARLLFIDSGRVTLFHQKGDERFLLGQLSRGDVLGEETFFNLSAPTFSAGAQTEVRLRYLDKNATIAWEEKQPGLYQKLADYCIRNCRANALLQQKKIEKRAFPRVKADCKVIGHVLDEHGGRAAESIRGSLIDISQLGVSFDIHCSRLETAQALLGRNLDLECEFAESASGNVQIFKGTIVKVGILMHNDYSIHVRLQTEIPSPAFKQYLRTLQV
jgi:hypothetical protein